eukprot:4718762-Amphidinium_carterae.1
MAFIDRGESMQETVNCWRQRILKRYGFEEVDVSLQWPDPFIGKRGQKSSPGSAMVACAESCDQENILFLEEDWELVTRPRELVQHRLLASMRLLSEADKHGTLGSVERRAAVIGVHLRHKLLFGPPFYELLTSTQHNEPPSPHAAWYFSEDPVSQGFPSDHWSPPFWVSLQA